MINKGDTIFFRVLKNPTTDWYERQVTDVYVCMQNRTYSLLDRSPHFPYTTTIKDVSKEVERTLIQVYHNNSFTWYALDELEYIVRTSHE